MRSSNLSHSQSYSPEFQNLNRPRPNDGTLIHVWRMRKAVACSIILQFIFLFVFIVLSNMNLLHPLTWFGNSFRTFVTLSVWLKLMLLVPIIYIQGEVCKKDYVSGPTYYSTRFHKIKHIFNVRNLLLLVFHTVIGMTLFWIYSSLPGSAYESFTKPCSPQAMSPQLEFCLVEDTFFLTLGGLWIGMYYFIHDYLSGSRNLSFPLIQQYKFYRFKAALKQSIRHSLRDTCFPICLFVVFYYLYGGFFRSKFVEFLALSSKTDNISTGIDTIQGMFNIKLLFFLWLFSSFFMVALRVMELLFNVHLTEHYVFPISAASSPHEHNMKSLIDSLKSSSIPIIQHLGYLDLFFVATKCVKRRKEVFTLSFPGGHPHTWNGIFQECKLVIKTFTHDLNEALQNASNTVSKGAMKPELKPEISGFNFHSHNMRNLASPTNYRSADFSNMRPIEYQSAIEVAFNNIQQWMSLKLHQLYKKPYISYFFAESIDSRINYLLCQSQLIIWAVESLSFISAASFTEDDYGIVQRDLSEIIITIVRLKQVLDKLFKQSLMVKKSSSNDPLEVQMKYMLRTSVKRSLYKLAVVFGPYVKELVLPVDVEMQFNNFIEFKEV